MKKIYQARLTNRDEKKLLIMLEKTVLGQYKVVNAQGYPTLEGFTLAFEPATHGVTNQDNHSDSFSCFGLSEHLELKGPALVFKSGTFYTKNLEHLQAGLDRLRGEFLDNSEF